MDVQFNAGDVPWISQVGAPTSPLHKTEVRGAAFGNATFGLPPDAVPDKISPTYQHSRVAVRSKSA